MVTTLDVNNGAMRTVELTEITRPHDSVLTDAAATVCVTVEEAGGVTRIGVAIDCGLIVSQMNGETRMRLRTAFFTLIPA